MPFGIQFHVILPYLFLDFISKSRWGRPLQLPSCLAEAAAAEDDLSGEPSGFVGGEKGSDQIIEAMNNGFAEIITPSITE